MLPKETWGIFREVKWSDPYFVPYFLPPLSSPPPCFAFLYLLEGIFRTIWSTLSFDSFKSSKGSESLQVQRGDRYVSPQVHWKPETQSMVWVWQGLQRTKAMLFSLLLWLKLSCPDEFCYGHKNIHPYWLENSVSYSWAHVQGVPQLHLSAPSAVCVFFSELRVSLGQQSSIQITGVEDWTGADWMLKFRSRFASLFLISIAVRREKRSYYKYSFYSAFDWATSQSTHHEFKLRGQTSWNVPSLRYITVSSCVAKEELHPAAAQHHGGVGRVLVYISSLREALNSESQVWFLPSALLHWLRGQVAKWNC